MDTNRRNFIKVGACAGAAAAWPAARAAAGEPLFRVGLITDTHVGKTKASCALLKAAWELFKREKVNLVVNVGDIADHHYPDGYRAIRECINEVYPDAKGRPDELWTWAWHDAYDYKGSLDRSVPHAAAAFADAQRILESPNGEWAQREYAGFPFLVFPQMLGQEGRIRYERTLAEAARKYPGKPIFVFDHEPPQGTVFNSVAWGNAWRRRTLNNYPNAIVVTGHTHGSLRNENNIWQGEFTCVNCGCLQVWGGGDELVGASTKSKPNFGAMVMDVHADKVVFRRFDDVRAPAEYRPDDRWTVPLPFDRATAPYRAEARAKTPPPEFPAGAALTVAPAAAPFSAFRLAWPQIPDPAEAYKYRVEVGAVEASGVCACHVRRDQFSEFHLDAARRRAVLEDEIPAAFFETGRKYRFTVTPVGFFGAEGRPLVAEAVAPAPADDVEAVLFDSADPAKDCPVFLYRTGDRRVEPKDGWLSACGRLELPAGVWDGPAGTKYRCIVDVATETKAPSAFSFGLEHVSPLHYAARARTEPGAPGVRRYVFEFAKAAADHVYVFYAEGGPGRMKFRRFVVQRLRKR